MNQIWMYWENVPGSRGMPPFVQFCLKSVERHRGQASLHLLDQDSVREYLPDLRPQWRQLQRAAHRADYVRTRLVLRHGGMWLDSDMVAMRPLAPLFEIPQPLDFACQEMASAIGCFVARAGCPLLQTIAREQDRILDADPTSFEWNAIGNDLLARHGSDYPHHTWVRWTLDEIAGGKVSRLLEDRRIEDNVDRNAALFHLCGNLLTPLLATYAPRRHQRLLGQSMLLSRILRRALDLPEPSTLGQRLDPALWGDTMDGLGRRAGRLLKGRG
ncbi:capsular polysaccharide synthesis protein [Rubrivivax gelatinosus]|uniref:Capsular polysaccharide synthesis protein n=1 Tax=Rubrivivax gelatinosus TaxID=28068 RepID=A0A4R2MJR6_RUBGE|nr:capsular polysaccharide synthesis protein [Rubrivivax gelatinosus]MBK1686092.1 hypothetical protein [Rubrivivax gelatinosus]TCP05585.1 capsular polysaccharide synthesis protein [Rubrivivax gelatinosus]